MIKGEEVVAQAFARQNIKHCHGIVGFPVITLSMVM